MTKLLKTKLNDNDDFSFYVKTIDHEPPTEQRKPNEQKEVGQPLIERPQGEPMSARDPMDVDAIAKFEDAVTVAQKIGESVSHQLIQNANIHTPNELTMELNLAFTAKGTIMVVEASGEASLKLGFKWVKPPDTPETKAAEKNTTAPTTE